MNRVLKVVLELLSQYWPLVLVAGMFGFMILLVILRALLRRRQSRSLPESNAQEPPTSVHGNTAKSSLKRLTRTHYIVLDEIYVPRFEGAGSTRLEHVVLSTNGIFVIHVQHERGIIKGHEKQHHWTCENDLGEKSLTNPILRNDYHVMALARFLGLPTALLFPIIYFENSVSFTSDMPAHLLTSGLGRYIISHKTELLSPELISNVLTRLQSHQAEQSIEGSRREYAVARSRRLREVRETITALITTVALT